MREVASQCKTFSIRGNCPTTGAVKLCLAELSPLDFAIVHDELGDQIVKPGQTWFWFARLNVPPAIRRMKFATRLMESVAQWADSEGVHILLGINPYGDLNFEQLVNFYVRFGFVAGPHELFYRSPGGK